MADKRREAEKKRFENIPAELRERRQWVVWAAEDRGETHPDGSPKLTKVPCRPDGSKRKASSTDARTWGTFVQAVSCYAAPGSAYAGIGYVFSKDDPYTGVDLDDCCPVPGEIEHWGAEIVELLGSYTEESPSRTGVHAIIRAEKPDKRCKKTSYAGKGKDVEVYDRGRFFCMTGSRLPDASTEIHERQDELTKLYAMLFPASDKTPATRPAPAGDDPAAKSDQELLALAANAKNGPKFMRLWGGDTSEHGGDESRADLALCCELAFWTGRDPERMDRLFRQSGLFRAKWDRADYAERTIQAAIDRTTEGYSPRHRRQAPGRRQRAKSEETNEPTGIYRRSDLGNAEFTCDRHGSEIAFDDTAGFFLVWDDTRFAPDSHKVRVMQRVTEAIRHIPEQAMRDDVDKSLRKEIFAHALRSENASRIAAATELLKIQPGIARNPEEFDSDPWLLNCQNGVLDLRTGRLLPHDPKYACTKLASVAFDPKAKCPLWESFLNTSLEGNEEHKSLLQRILGYALTGITTEEKLFLFSGMQGRNGKGVCTGTFQSLMGDYGQQADPETFLQSDRNGARPREDLASLRGARIATASEIPPGRRLDIPLIKGLTGNDPIRCRRLHENGSVYRPQFKIIISCNHKPQIPEGTRAIWDRIVLFPWSRYIPPEERDLGLKAKLLAELPGILNWCLRGCLDWQQGGLQIPRSISQATSEYEAEEDALGEFLAARCLLSVTARVAHADLFAEYMAWCEEAGEKPLGKRIFGRRLLERGGITNERGTKNRAEWQGISLAVGGEL